MSWLKTWTMSQSEPEMFNEPVTSFPASAALKAHARQARRSLPL